MHELNNIIVRGEADIAEQENRELLKQAEQAVNISQYFTTPIHLTRMIARENIRSVMFEGEGGLGKTHTILSTLKEEKTNFRYIRGYTTPLSLYIDLYKHRETPVIVIDDTDGIFRNNIGKSLIKSVLDPQINETHYHSTQLPEGIPDNFIPQSRYIICANQYPNDSDFKALRDRCVYYLFSFNYKQKIDILRLLSKLEYKDTSQEDRDIIFGFINKHSNKATNLSIRTLFKVYDLYLYDRSIWQNIAKEVLHDDTALKVVIEAMKHDTVADQIKHFMKNTGMSRATFYRLRAKVK